MWIMALQKMLTDPELTPCSENVNANPRENYHFWKESKWYGN